jgi:uridine phosphorylase
MCYESLWRAFGSSIKARRFPDWSRRIRWKKELIMAKEHELVVLLTSMSVEGLEAGDVGTVVHVYRDGEAYEVEFVALDGRTRAVVTVEANQVHPVSRRDMTHAREVQTA